MAPWAGPSTWLSFPHRSTWWPLRCYCGRHVATVRITTAWPPTGWHRLTFISVPLQSWNSYPSLSPRCILYRSHGKRMWVNLYMLTSVGLECMSFIEILSALKDLITLWELVWKRSTRKSYIWMWINSTNKLLILSYIT